MTFPNLKVELPTNNIYKILEALEYFRNTPITHLDEKQLAYIEKLAKCLNEWAINPDTKLTGEKYIRQAVRCSVVIANVFAISSVRSTDSILTNVINQKDNLVKTLMFYTARNTIKLNLRALFELYPLLTSYWWSNQLGSIGNTRSVILKHVDKNMRTFVSEVPDDLFTLGAGQFVFENQQLCLPYFDVTYIDAGQNMRIRNMINREMKRINSGIKPNMDNRDYNTIVIISGGMEPGHAVSRSVLPLIKQLKGHYKLILVNHHHAFTDPDNVYDKEYHVNIKVDDEKVKLISLDELVAIIEKERPGVALFPEVGLSQTSIQMSNMRLAPIQITMHGHPVSTGDSEIDYFIGGEYDKQEDYTEKLIKLPGSGLGVTPLFNGYRPISKHDNKHTIIGCNWGNLKFNYKLFSWLRAVISEQKDTELRFFAVAPKGLSYLVTWLDLKELFKGIKHISISLCVQMNMFNYLNALEQCDYLIDSFPFGGHNRVADAAQCGRSTIVHPSYCITHFGEDMIRKFGYNDIKNLDLETLLWSEHKKTYFKEAVDKIIESHYNQSSMKESEYA